MSPRFTLGMLIMIVMNQHVSFKKNNETFSMTTGNLSINMQDFTGPNGGI